jgi:drug/metabolite transporter (DMT)-like permease
MIFVLLIALAAILLLVSGQTLLKVGLNDIGGVSLFDGDPLGSLLGLFRTPWIILGFVPMVSLTYVFAVLIGRFVFQETVGLDRILGVAFILIGLFFIIRSGR